MLMRKRIIIVLSLLAISLCTLPAYAQDGNKANKDVLGALRYRHIGPTGNRLTSVVGIPGQPNIYYVGAASGGIWKTVDGGVRSHRSAHSRLRQAIRILFGPAQANPGYAAISR